MTWHPFKEELFASAAHDGHIIIWAASMLGKEGMLHKIEKAHNTQIWGMAWDPTGQMLASTGNDQRVRFWGKQKPYEKL